MHILFRLVKNINKDIVYSMKLDEVKEVSSVTCQVHGQSSINFVENQDYKIITDESTLFLIITKRMKSQEKHHLAITILDKHNIIQDWKISCQPKGKKTKYLYKIKIISLYTGDYKKNDLTLVNILELLLKLLTLQSLLRNDKCGGTKDIGYSVIDKTHLLPLLTSISISTGSSVVTKVGFELLNKIYFTWI